MSRVSPPALATAPGVDVPSPDEPHTLTETQALLRDVIALSTLPAVWMGAQPQRIAESLLGVLETTLRPVFSYIRLPSLDHGVRPLEHALIEGQAASAEELAALGPPICEWAAAHDPDELMDAPRPLAGRRVRICVYPLGHEAGVGVLAAGFLASAECPPLPTPLQCTLLNVAANQAITAYRNVVLQAQAEAARQETQALYDVSRALAAELDLQTILQKTTDAVTRLTGAKFGAFFHNVIEEGRESYRLFTLSGAPREAFEKFETPRNTPMFDHTFRGKGPVRLDDVRKDPRYGQVAPHHGLPKGHLPVCSYLAVPVLSRTGEVFGGLFLGHPEPGVFTERAERIAVGVAGQAAVALENSRLFTRANTELAQRKEAEALLREEERRKDEFLATLSHELRNPLAPIRTALEVLKLSQHDPARRQRAMEAIGRQSSHLMRLVDDLLDVSRITRGKIELRKQTVELASLVAQAIEAVRPLSDARRLRLFADLPAHPIRLEADPVRVVQILGNLLHNACKYSRDGGEIHVRAEARGTQACVSVRDDGIGIEPGQLARIFDLFAQVEDSTSRAPGGLGIGLSLARSLAELHDGTIEARSDGLGHGSEFIVHLPALPPVAPKASPPPERALVTAEGDGALQVVAVDDYMDALESLVMLLELFGHQVRIARDGAETVRVVAAQRPDVVFLDIGLPDVDGYEVARRLRALPGGDEILLVAMTGWGQDRDKQKALAAGFDLHLTKPADPDELERILMERAAQKRAATAR